MHIKYKQIMPADWNKIKLLKGADPDVLRMFEQCGWMVAYDSGGHVILEGDLCEAIFFLQKGIVEIYHIAVDGREQTLRILNTGESFNLVPALKEGGRNRANARCLQPCELLVIKAIDFRNILAKHPQFSNHVLRNIAERLGAMIQFAGELSLLSVRQRTAAFLIREADMASGKHGRSWTQDEMARQVGTVRDVIGRTLRNFEELGLIRRDRGRISLIDREKLTRIAEGEDTT